MRTRIPSILILAAALLLPQAASAQRPPDPDMPVPLREVGFEQKLGESVPLELSFSDHTGAPVRLGELVTDRPVVLALVYYECPMLCNMVLNGLVSSLDVLTFDPGRDFDVVVVSFDPGETPALAAAKRANYLERYGRAGTEEGWHFLTGRPAEIDALTSSVGFRYVYDEEKDQYAHASGIVVLTPRGVISRYLFGIEYAPKDLRLALVDSAEGKVGGFVDQLLLFCYHYDPATGKYGAAVINLIRLGGVLTIGGLLAFILLMRRRERRSARRLAEGVA